MSYVSSREADRPRPRPRFFPMLLLLILGLGLTTGGATLAVTCQGTTAAVLAGLLIGAGLAFLVHHARKEAGCAR